MIFHAPCPEFLRAASLTHASGTTQAYWAQCMGLNERVDIIFHLVFYGSKSCFSKISSQDAAFKKRSGVDIMRWRYCFLNLRAQTILDFEFFIWGYISFQPPVVAAAALEKASNLTKTKLLSVRDTFFFVGDHYYFWLSCLLFNFGFALL